ncbi:akirin 2 [Plakobranchus ocellatus]|uniref:Akirin 2 n=1 Tax=Plakobranchus ocellatus TaxID=259542 RepID=A0AAV3XYH2_9GAST|nr:akirin 2 [Plakobranchus ocellatus]
MACGATLKRSLEFDPLHSPSQSTPIKRRRCMPMTMVQTTPPTKIHQLSPSPFAEVSPKLTKEEIAARIGSELKRIQRRKQLVYPSSHSPPLTTCSALGRQSPPNPMNPDVLASVAAISNSDFHASLPSTSSGLSSPKQKDVPLFTFKQVAMICERMVHDHEEKIKEQYDKVLNNKLSEQYEAFLKFNHDQLQKRFGNAPMSYVS